MRFRGDWKDSIEIYTYSESQDSLGQPVKTWSKSSTILGFINDNNGLKQYKNETTYSNSSGMMFCDGSVTISTKDRIKSVTSGRIYDVLYIKPILTSVNKLKKFLMINIEYNSDATL